MNVPGRKNMVTAAMVIMDELSLWASLAIAEVDFEIWRLMSLSSWVERWKAYGCQLVLSKTSDIKSKLMVLLTRLMRMLARSR
jgi:hypothetical protein